MTSTPPSLIDYDSATAFQPAVQRDGNAIFAQYQALVQSNSKMSTAGLTLQATVSEQATIISEQASRIEVRDNEIASLQNMYLKLQGKIEELRESKQELVQMLNRRQSESQLSPRLSPKHPDPEMFNGKREDLVRFTNQLKIKIHQNKDHFAVPKSDIFYSISRLEGDAMAQVQPMIISESEVNLDSMTEFFDLLQLAFGDPDKKGTAQRAIRFLRQTNRDFHEYLADFQRYIPDTHYDDEAKLAALIEGLSTELKNMLQYVPTPTSFPEAIKTLQELENKRKKFGSTTNRNAPRPGLRNTNLAAQWSADNSRSSFGAPSSVYTPASSIVAPQSSVSNVSSHDPMDLSTSRPRGPLSAAEKDRRKRFGLCLYCGREGHLARNCILSNKKPSQLNEVTTIFEVPAPQGSENVWSPS